MVGEGHLVELVSGGAEVVSTFVIVLEEGVGKTSPTFLEASDGYSIGEETLVLLSVSPLKGSSHNRFCESPKINETSYEYQRSGGDNSGPYLMNSASEALDLEEVIKGITI
ncbi:hypothetical protein K2173_009764 [Erythroxylum novogranatense]|uniref:Uncharacterized protein n=1 Tax=Erythroxylum novogranatense TaxID=1862640 RepID=A0AAV8T099_9ROSI|nr:hypothetical protein K2173_009764 [Erythroxylum novogranatense]